MHVAVVIPAYNEALTVRQTIEQFHRFLPEAEIVVVDNASTDATGDLARAALHDLGCSGCVLVEHAKGKANAVRRAFLEVHADCYVMVDADMTYPAHEVQSLLDPVLRGDYDMTVGDRISNGRYAAENKRKGHGWGNALVARIINFLYKSDLHDVLSGYRVFSKRFVKNYPVLVRGFELETDLTLHALQSRHRVLEVPITYCDRPEGSTSKLNTVRDGVRVLNAIFQIFRHYRPMAFFGSIGVVLLLCGLLAGYLPLEDYLQFRYVYHLPLAVLAVGLVLSSLFAFSTGLVLSTIARGQQAQAERGLLAQEVPAQGHGRGPLPRHAPRRGWTRGSGVRQ